MCPGFSNDLVVDQRLSGIERNAPDDFAKGGLPKSIDIIGREVLAVAQDVEANIRPELSGPLDEMEELLLVEGGLASGNTDQTVRRGEEAGFLKIGEAIDMCFLRRLRAHHAQLVAAFGHKQRIVR